MSSSDTPLRLVILISGRGSNALAIHQAIVQKRIECGLSILAVIADSSAEQPAAGLDAAASIGLDTAQISPAHYPDKRAFEQDLIEVIDSYSPDLLVLAGFMRVLSAQFVRHYRRRMVNIHPSLLPKYRGLHTHQRALDAGDVVHGASVHWVTADLDAGPVLTQVEIQINADDTADSLAQRLLIEEHRLYPATLALIAQLRVLSEYEPTKAQPDRWILDRDFDDAGRIINPLLRSAST